MMRRCNYLKSKERLLKKWNMQETRERWLPRDLLSGVTRPERVHLNLL